MSAVTLLKSMVAIALFSGVVFSCGKINSATKENQRSPFDPEAAKLEVEVASSLRDDGSVAGLISYAFPNTQVLKVSADVSFKGTNLYFPPTSFDIDQEVSISAFQSLAHRANVTTLIDGKTKILGVGPSIQISWTYDQDTFLPYAVAIPVPATSLSFNDDQEPAQSPGSSLVVFYLKNDPVLEQYVLGYLPQTDLTYKNGVVSFTTTSYGVYQPAWIDSAPTEGKTINAGVDAPTSENLPEAFEMAALPAKIYSKSATVSWGLSDLATSYDVLVSNKNAACSEPSKTYKGLLKRSKSLEFTANGDTWICVFAKNTAGATPAKNNGIKISIDQTAPPAPTKPVSVEGNNLNTVNLRFSWNAVTDVGPAGIRHYFLQVGSTPGGNDHFSSIVQEPSQFISATNGAVYYARVKVVDNAGNESEWSPVSDRVTVNTD